MTSVYELKLGREKLEALQLLLRETEELARIVKAIDFDTARQAGDKLEQIKLAQASITENKTAFDEGFAKFSTQARSYDEVYQSLLKLKTRLEALLADNVYLKKTEKAADSDKLDGLDSTAFIQTTQGTLISEYAHITHGQMLPDGDYSSSDFWLSVKPGIYYAVREKGRNGPTTYGLVEIISNGEISITWSHLGEVWKWYQGFDKSNRGWEKVTLDRDFNCSKTLNGYTKLPNGVIIQWGIDENVAQGDNQKSTPFPIAFPNACLSITATHVGADRNVSAIIAGRATASGVVLRHSWSASPTAVGYIAIGY